MPNKIKPCRSYTANSVPLVADLEENEMAVNWTDGKIFVRQNNAIVTLTLGGSGGSGGSLSGSVTIPASGDPYWTDTVLLLKGDGNLSDSSSNAFQVTAYGNAAVSTAEKKFGSASISLDGSGDYLADTRSAYAFGTGNFTVECWAYNTESLATADNGLFHIGNSPTGPSMSGVAVAINSPGLPAMYSGGSQVNGTVPISLNTWHHYALVRSGSTMKLYVDGQERISSANAANLADTNLIIGVYYNTSYAWQGYISDFRITKAARYTATFTPPTATYAIGAYTAAQTLPVTVTGSGGVGSGLTWSSVPASATATGAAGSIAYDGSYLYLAPQSNTWVRAALSTWSNFTPASVTGLQLWLDASDANSLYDATSGGSLVTADGGVARWEDKSGNGRHATQSTSGNRPLRKTSVQGGKDVLLFDGSDDNFVVSGSSSSLKFLHSAASTIFLVLSRPTNASYATLLSSSNGSSLSVGFWLGSVNGSSTSDKIEYQVYRNVDNSFPARSATGNGFLPSGYSVLSIVADLNASPSGRAAIRRNGVGTVFGNTDTAAASTANSMNDLAIGCFGSIVAPFINGSLCEICIYNAALSDTDRAAVESYLMTKWAIT